MIRYRKSGHTGWQISAIAFGAWQLGRFIGGVFQVTILWWIGAALVWGVVQHFTRSGNWLFAMGGDTVSARNAGIPTDRTTILLVMCSGASATFVGVSQTILYNPAQVSAGQSYILDNISLNLRAGEVLCLLGDKGASKSSVIRLLSGVHKPTSGTLETVGKPVTFDNPHQAWDHGIATVHQFGGTSPLKSIG